MPARKKTNKRWSLKKILTFLKNARNKLLPEKQQDRRTKKGQKYNSFKLQKKIRSKPLEEFNVIFKRSLLLLRSQKLLIVLHSLIFAALYLLFVRGIGGGIDIQAELDAGTGNRLASSVSAFGSVFSGASATRSSAASVLQVLLFIVFSLSLLWLLRNIRSKEKNINILDAYYFGPAQVVPYGLVLVFTLLQLVPLAFGNSVITTARRNNLIISNLEQLAFLAIATFLAAISFYLVSGGLFGLIVSSLPGAKPVESIRAGADLVKHRRWAVAARIFIMLLIVSVCTFIITLPVILLLPAASEYVFYLCSVATLVLMHAFMYELYRGLLK